ncbi:MAG TPA: SpoIIE family protein phosphatase [Anaerolineae bacterium]|nr:SpoIIE family protein phosphatase [Anaerolineae bacterium]HNT06527.1 SpoIIE family protein phosphatase [Anaerolineae bacterium]
MKAITAGDLIHWVPAFAVLPQRELEHLAALGRRETFPANALLLLEGQSSERLYVLLDGRVDILKALGTDGERLLGVRGPGSFIGEMSLFDGEGAHTASVRAATELEALSLPRSEMAGLISRQPALAYDLVRTMSQRLDESENQTIRDLLQKNRELTRAYDELRAAQAQLVEKERLEVELGVARSIQRSFLPRAAPKLPRYEFGMLIEPVSSVGGDLCAFFPLKGDRLGIAIGDVSGHGVGSALFMALAFSLLRGEASRGGAPDKVLRSVNRQLSGISDSGMFVTLLYGILDGPVRAFTYARAGHPSPVVARADGSQVVVAQGVGQPLGLFEELVLDMQNLAIPEGGKLLLYTDGATEASNSSGEQFGAERLFWTLSQAGHQSAQSICEKAFGAVRAHCGAASPEDDILLVSVRATA